MICLAGLAAKALFNAKHDAGAVRSWWGELHPSTRKWTVRLVVIVAGFLVHQHFAGKAIEAAEKRGAAAAYSNVAKRAGEIAGKANEVNSKAAELMRDLNDEKLDTVARDADDLRVRGPGAARCSAVAGLPAAAGGREPAGRPADAAVDPMRDGGGADLIALPFTGAVDFGSQHDAFRIEALGWREWHSRFSAEWAAWNAEAKRIRADEGGAKP